MNKELKFKFHAPLNKEDTAEQTYGCRVNPNICAYADMENVCAFVREDHICKQPSKKWPKQYELLKSKEKGSTK